MNGRETEEIASIPPEDIERVETLPADEETIARYGLRASNGVLLVTLRYDSPAVVPSDPTFWRYNPRRREGPDGAPPPAPAPPHTTTTAGPPAASPSPLQPDS